MRKYRSTNTYKDMNIQLAIKIGLGRQLCSFDTRVITFQWIKDNMEDLEKWLKNDHRPEDLEEIKECVKALKDKELIS